MPSLLVLLLVVIVCLVQMVAITGTSIKVHLNYEKDGEHPSISNSHTGVKLNGVGNSVSSKITEENMRNIEKSKQQSYSTYQPRKGFVDQAVLASLQQKARQNKKN